MPSMPVSAWCAVATHRFLAEEFASASVCLGGELSIRVDGLILPRLYASSAIIISRITNFCTLPVTVIGKLSTKRMWRGILKCVIRPRQKPRISSSVADNPGRSLIQAHSSSP